MQGEVINPSRGQLTVGSQRLMAGFLDLSGDLRISFSAPSFKPPLNGKAKLDGRDIIIEEVKAESPFQAHRTWTLLAHFADTEA